MSPSISASARFTRIYDTLPPEDQRALVRELIALLDIVPKHGSRKVLAAATRIQKRTANVPVLDLKTIEKEFNSVLDELRRDSKRALVNGFSHREELLAEAVQSVLHWLNDIWTVVYEYRVNFAVAHSCLLIATDLILELGSSRAECNCEFMNMFVSLKVKNGSSEIVKVFSLRGAQNIERILLWIWRELFLSMLSCIPPPDEKKILGMLSDIENAMGWHSLHRLLYGGWKSPHCGEDDDGDVIEDLDCEDEDYLDDIYSCDAISDDSNSSYGNDGHCSCRLRAKHWSKKIKQQRSRLQHYVLEHLTSTFKITPSLNLFNSIITISRDSLVMFPKLMTILSSSATSSSDTFAAALEIFTAENQAKKVSALLDSHSHLLRPRDAPILQSSVVILALYPAYQLRALQILEKEFIDTTKSMSFSISACFSNIDRQVNKTELSRIMQLRQGSTMRQDRLRQWVDAVITPGTDSPHPIAFAAMMMGLPFVPGMDSTNSSDPLGYLDVEHTDKDLEYLRDELRPKLKERFDGWNEAAQSIKGGPGVLLRIYTKVVELMPFIQAPDVIDEMITRLAEKPSKHHICDALSTLSSFGKILRRKARRPANNQPSKTTPAANRNAQNGTGKTASSGPNKNASTGPSSSQSPPTPAGEGGMNDVD